jgi:hypothetical protein
MRTHPGLFTAIGVGRSIRQSPPSLLLHACFCSSTPLCLHAFSLDATDSFCTGRLSKWIGCGPEPSAAQHTHGFFEPDTGTLTPYFYVVVGRGVSKPACGVFDPSGSQARRCLTKLGLIHGPSTYTVSEAPLVIPWSCWFEVLAMGKCVIQLHSLHSSLTPNVDNTGEQ